MGVGGTVGGSIALYSSAVSGFGKSYFGIGGGGGSTMGCGLGILTGGGDFGFPPKYAAGKNVFSRGSVSFILTGLYASGFCGASVFILAGFNDLFRTPR